MVKKEFSTKQGYLHIPVYIDTQERSHYIEVMADGVLKNEFLISVVAPGEDFHFYVAMDVARYQSDKVTLICREEGISEDFFDGIVEGTSIWEEAKEHPALYPDLYREPIRQQIHFSPARGWMNDPNGLFYRDGVFHMYFQHNPFDNHHYTTNVSWGHATSTDGVHFTEYDDPIMPRNSLVSIASGSALVDRYNISGMGSDTILAAYTDLDSKQYHGRPQVISGVGQNVLYSRDGGKTYQYFDGNPVIKVPDYQHWRDPKLIQIDKKTLGMAVYETYEGRNCVSFYKSADCVHWEFCSRNMDLYECPDLFSLKVVNSEETMWVLYGAGGKYRIGHFKDFVFETVCEGGFIDYGDCVYAGQTFNNYAEATGDHTKRIYTAWLQDKVHDGWTYNYDEPNKGYGFSQAMALYTELSIHKTKDGYRLYRAPIKALETLRRESCKVQLNGITQLPVPSETVFTLKGTQDARIVCGKTWFAYEAAARIIKTLSGKEYQFETGSDLFVRLIADTRSVEVYIQDEIVLSFDVAPWELHVECGYELGGVRYRLESIWK